MTSLARFVASFGLSWSKVPLWLDDNDIQRWHLWTCVVWQLMDTVCVLTAVINYFATGWWFTRSKMKKGWLFANICAVHKSHKYEKHLHGYNTWWDQPDTAPRKKTLGISSLKRWIWWSQVDSGHAEGILQVSISCGHLGSHQIPGWTMNFSDWMIGFQSRSTAWALKGSSVLLRGKLRIWFALSPWRYLHGCWLHCPQRPDAGDSTFGRSWFDFLRYAKQPRSCRQGKRWKVKY